MSKNLRHFIFYFLTIFIVIFSINNGLSQNRYWVNGTGSWDNPNHWSETTGGKAGASIPSENDNVIFDNNSFTGNNQQVLIKGNAICNDFRWEVEKYKPILKSSSFLFKSITKAELEVHGSLIIGENIENEFFGNIVLRASEEQKLIFNSELNSDIIIDAENGEYILNADLSTKGNLIIKSGTFITNDNDIICNEFISSGTENRALHLGSSEVSVSVWNFEESENISLDPGKSIILFKNDFSKKTLKPGGLDYNKFSKVGAKSAFTYTIDLTPVTCNGDEDGIITANITSGGTSPFTYKLFDSDLNLLESSGPIPIVTYTFKPTAAPGVSGGSYLVRISDDDGTTDGEFVFINEPGVLSAGSITVQTSLSCFGGSDAALEANPTGGTVAVDYTYDWFKYVGAVWVPIGQTTKIATGLSQGVYRVYVDDDNNCGPDYVQFAFTKPPRNSSEIPDEIVFDSYDSKPECSGSGDGTIDILASGGTGDIDYYLYGQTDGLYYPSGGVPPPPYDPDGSFTGLSAQTYETYAIDANGCEKQGNDIIITNVPNPVASILPDPAEACPSVDLALDGNPSGGSGTYSNHSWTDVGAASLNFDDIETPLFNNGTAGNYDLTYTVTDDNGCSGSDNITVTVKEASVAPTGATTNQDNFCPGAFANILLKYVGGTLGTGATAEWYSDATFLTNVGSGQNLIIAAPVVTTTYYVRFEGDCNNTTAASILVTVKIESTDPTGINTDNDNFCPGESANLTVQGGSLGDGASWEWYTGSCGGVTVGSGPTLNVSPVVTTTYWVRAEGDCNTTACANITITVKTESTDPTGINTDNDNFCPGGSANLTVQGGSLGDGASWEWYSGSCGGTAEGTGAGISVSPTVTTTYYVRAEGDCNTTACANITITVKTASVAPTGATVDNNNFCPGDFPNITLSYVGGTLGTGATAEWYSDATFLTNVGSGQDLTIASPATTTTYYVRFEGDCNNTTAASILVTVKTESTDPTGANSDNGNFCPGGSTNLTVQGGSLGTGATWEWYSGSCGGTSEGTGASITVSPAVTTTYYVRAEGDCNTTACANVTVTVKEASVAPTGATVDNNNFCPGAFANITLSYVGGTLGTGATAEWYSDAGFTTNVGSGQDLTIASPATTTTYYVRFEGDCNNTTAASVIVTIKVTSTDPTGINTDNDNFCPGGSANLTVQGGSLGTGASWEWYTGSCGGVSVGTGSTLNVSPVVTTTYYVRAEGDCNTTACVNITVTVKTESTDPTGINTDDDNFCPGGSANLTVQGGSLGTGATWEWYSGSCGGTPEGSGAGISVSPTVTTTYYVRAEGDCNTTACANITITVKTASVAPTGATVDNNNFCPGDFPNITLSYVGGTLGTGATAEWYSDPTFLTNVGSGQDLTIASPATTTTYYVRFEGDCNNTTAASILVTVKPESTDPTGINTDNDNFCPGGSANLTVQGGSLGTGANWEWYSGSCGGTPEGTGAGISVSPTVTTTYYVRAEGDCNTTACANITITVKEASVAPTGATVDNNNFCPGDFPNITLSYVGGTLGTGATAEWYSDAGFTTNVGSGQDLTIASPATTTTYYVRFEGDCNNTTAASVTVTIKVESTDPTGVNTDNDNFCPGESANLTVQGGSLGDGASWEWYTGSCGGVSVGSGSTLNVSPVVTTTYWVRAEGDCNTTACANITITVKTESTDPTGINTDNDNFCPGGSANLTVQGGSLGDGASWEWYSGSCGGTAEGTGAGISVSPIVTTTYYVRAEGDCNTTACANITITVKTASVAPTGATVDNNNFCPGDFPNITLSYVGGTLGTGATAEWYSDPTFLTNVGSGQDLTIASPATTTTYYVRFEGDCNNTTAASVTVTVKTESTDPTGINTDNDNFCPGGSANLTVQGGSLGTGATWEWYSGSCGGTPEGTGAGIAVSPTVTTTYYVRAEGDCNTTACANITITVKEASVAPTGATVDNNNFCPGDFPNITLSYVGGTLGTGATAEWYSDAGFTTNVGSGQDLTIASPATTTTYYVRFEGDCNNTTAASVTVIIKVESIAPTSASVDNNNFCEGTVANITLSYTGGTFGTNATAEWYSDATFLTNVGSGQDLTIAAPAVTTTYYVRFEGDCNNTAAASITVTVNSNPTANITPDPATTCTAVDYPLFGNPLGGAGAPYASHVWTGADITPLSSTSVEDPIFNSGTSGTYSFTYTVTDDNGCVGSDNIDVTVYESATAYAGVDTTLCYGTPYYIQDADSINCSGISWSTDGGDGTFDDNGLIDPTYTPGSGDLLNGFVKLVLTSNGNAPCGNVTDTIEITYLSELLVAIGKPTPFYIDSTTTPSPSPGPTHIEVYVKLSGHDYLANIGVYLVSPLDSVVELKPNCAGFPIGAWHSAAVYRFYNDPLDTSAIAVIDECDASSGRYEFSGEWKKKLHGQDPANGAWRVRIVDYENWGAPGLLEEATIKFSDYNIDAVFETILYADSSINKPTKRYSAVTGPGVTDHTLTITGLTTSCFGVCDAKAVATASGGLSPYKYYEWSQFKDFSLIYATGDTVDLCTGTFYVQVTDSHDCTAIDSVLVGEPPEIVITNDTVVHNRCNGNAEGKVMLEFTGGTGALQYTYNGADWYNSGDTIFNLGAATYTFTIEDISGCTKDTTITINEPTEILISTTFTDITCYGVDNGRIEITASGGTPAVIPPAYNYSIDSAYNWFPGNIFTPLPQDTFYIAVQDSLGCIQFGDTVEMNYPDTITITSIVTVPYSCFGTNDDGEITINATGGVGTLEYSINGIDFQISSTFTGLIGGTYSVYVKDDCYTKSLIDTAHITGPDPITIDVVDITDVNTCYGDNTGQIIITAGGGTGVYEYSINGGTDYQAGNSFTGLYAGPYVIKVKDDDDCTSPDSTVNINEPPELLINDFTIINASECNPDLTGSITIIAAGGTGAYEYNIDGGTYQSSSTFSGIDVGLHTFIVRDANGCIASEDTSITLIDPLTATFSITDVSCNGFADGAITAIPSDGLPSYSYSWETGATTPTITGLTAGFYSVTITDSNQPDNCIFVGTAEVVGPEVLSISPDPRNKRCINSPSRNLTNSLGRVIVDVDGGTPSYTYSWTGPSGFTSNNDTIKNLQPGLYSLTVTDGRGCNTTYSTTLIEDNSFDILSYDVQLDDNSVCWNDSVRFTSTYVGNVDTIFMQVIDLTTFLATNWFYEVNNVNPFRGRYKIEGKSNFDFIRATNQYCKEDTTNILVEYFPDFELDIIDELDGNSEDDTLYLKGSTSGQLAANVTGSADISFAWTPSETLSNPNSQATVVSPDESGWYTVIATSTDDCKDSSSIYLEFIPAITPNSGFSPNGDGINDYWKIKYIGKFQNNIVTVYSRWGVKVFEQKGYDNYDTSKSWDGKAKNGKDLPSGTYYYVIILNEEGFPAIKGSITIIR